MMTDLFINGLRGEDDINISVWVQQKYKNTIFRAHLAFQYVTGGD